MLKSIPQNFFDETSPVAVVAGGAGFIGSSVCELLLERSVKVICIDNWQTGVKENVGFLLSNPRFQILEVDINDGIPQDLKRADYVFHLAGIEAYLNGEDLSIQTLEANSVGTRNLLSFASKHQARFLLASTINVYSAQISASGVVDYFGKSREKEGEFSQHEAKRFAEVLVSEYGQKRNVDVRIVRLGDVYGPRMTLSTNGNVSCLVKQALYKMNLEVSGQQELVIYPVYISDVAEGIVKSLFSGGTKNSIISLTGPKTTLFDLARKVKQISGDLEIKFVDKEFYNEGLIKEEILHSGQKIIAWSPKVGLDEGLTQTLEWFSNNKQRIVQDKKEKGIQRDSALFRIVKKLKVAKSKGKVSATLVIQKKEKPAFWGIPVKKSQDKREYQHAGAKLGFFVLPLFLGLVFWIFGTPFLFFGVGIVEMSVARSSINKGEYTAAQNQFYQAKSLFQAAENGFSNWNRIPGLEVKSIRFSQKSRAIAQFMDIGAKASQTTKRAAGLFGSMMTNDFDTPAANKEELVVDIRDLEKKLGFLKTMVGVDNIEINIPFYKNIFVTNLSVIEQLQHMLSASSTFLTNFDELLGKDGKKTYAILLQDNSELRPGGGVVKALFFATFERGHLISTEVHDISSLDSQLRGHVDPPSAIKTYLGQDNWYLQDATWSPDFPTSAQKIAWFIDKEVGQKIDGVVMIDLEFVKNFLTEFGEVKLDGTGEVVNKDNIYLKVQTKDPKASAQMAASVLGKVVAVLESDPVQGSLRFVETFFDALEDRHASVWTNTQGFNLTFDRLGWSGTLEQEKCKSINCTDDYFSVVEANLGSNKVNVFLEKRYALELSSDKDSIVHKLLVTFKNKSPRDSWPGGEYKNYLRLVAQKNSKLRSATLIDTYTGQQELLSFDQGREKDKEVFGMLVLVPVGMSKQLVLVWDYPTHSKGEVILTWQKQAGTLTDPVSIKINDIRMSKPVVLKGSGLTQDPVVGYNTNLSQDLVLEVPWQQSK